MPELNFDDLRKAVENDTSIPEFREVRRRARRHRRWRVLINAARILGILIIATPAIAIGDVVFTHLQGPGPDTTATGTAPNGTKGSPAPPVITATVVAADGIDPEHTYALIDVCAAKRCNLQLAQVNPPTAQAQVQRTGLLRNAASDRLIDPWVTVEDTSTVVVSGIVNSGVRQYQTVSVEPVGGAVPDMTRPVQTTVQGPICSIRNGSARILPNQPPLTSPVLASTTKGWWVVGTTPTGQLALSVSHDDGRTWSAKHGMGIVPDSSTPGGTLGAAFATADGHRIYALARSRDQMTLLVSTDAGVTWSPTATSQQWPAGSRYGLVVTPSGTLIAWFSTSSRTRTLSSTDGGQTFGPATVPNGPIIPTGHDLMVLGTNPSTSRDGSDWESAYVPFVSVSD